MKTSKKYLAYAIVSALALSALTGCGNNDGNNGGNSTGNSTENSNGNSTENSTENSSENSNENSSENSSEDSNENSSAEFDMTKEINVLTREDGSGTRGAFIELFGIEQKNEAGEKMDYTTDAAAVTNSTSVMMTTVAGDLYSIGYISLGSWNDTVKTVQIDGAEATVENIKNGTYKIARPFNIATKEDVSATAQDFIDFIMSADGQAVIEENGYISVSDAESYSGAVESGKIIVAGSSSVTPVMEKLKEAYVAKNPGVTIEIQQNDSSTGISYAIDGTCDIGMASRELKDSETEKGLTATVIAMDGITVIVNNDCPIDNLTSQKVKDIFTGTATSWNEISQ